MGQAKIYTRKGDRGLTGLLGSKRIGKNDGRVHAYGTLDELNAHLGFARNLIHQESIQGIIIDIQEDIFTAASELASTQEALSRLKRRIGPGDVGRLEHIIDEITVQYGLPRAFVMPGDHLDSAALHVARTVCRRAERLMVDVNGEDGLYKDVLQYFNRLSDLLFALSWRLDVDALVDKTAEAVCFLLSAER